MIKKSHVWPVEKDEITQVKLEKPLKKLFQAHGRLVAQYPKVFIIVPVIFTVMCAGGAAYIVSNCNLHFLPFYTISYKW